MDDPAGGDGVDDIAGGEEVDDVGVLVYWY